MDNEIKNASGYTDVTAYKALQNVCRKERRDLILLLKQTAENYGYEITSRIELKEIKEADNL